MDLFQPSIAASDLHALSLVVKVASNTHENCIRLGPWCDILSLRGMAEEIRGLFGRFAPATRGTESVQVLPQSNSIFIPDRAPSFTTSRTAQLIQTPAAAGTGFASDVQQDNVSRRPRRQQSEPRQVFVGLHMVLFNPLQA